MQPREDRARRPYTRPALTVFGSVEALTQAGFGSKVEKHPLKPGSKIRPR